MTLERELQGLGMYQFNLLQTKGIQMEVIAFLIVGMIAGWVAGIIVQGHGLGTFGDIIVGVMWSQTGELENQ